MKRWPLLGACLPASLLALALAMPCHAADFYVDAGTGSDANDGLAWTSPKRSINAALAAATATPEPDVVSVAAGAYFETIVMPPAVSLLGSFLNGGTDQDIQVHPSVIDARGRDTVVQLLAGTDACVLRSFIIRNGGTLVGRYGGGIHIIDSGARVEDCVIERNVSPANTAGLLISLGPAFIGTPPVIQRCVIRDNNSGESSNAGIYIGCISSRLPAPIVLRDCIVERNVTRDPAQWQAAALSIYAWRTDVLLENVVVRQNSSNGAHVSGRADGIVPVRPLRVIRNCEFSDNARHGLILTANWDNRPEISAHFEVTNCTFRGNGRADIGTTNEVPEFGAITLDMQRCVLAGGRGDFRDDMGVLVLPGNFRFVPDPIADNTVPGGMPLCPDNLDAVPVFATGPAGASYLSQVAAGQALDSPGVDASPALASDVGMDSRTTRTDHVVDAGACDHGVHYGDISIFGDVGDPGGPGDGLLDVRRRAFIPMALPLVARVTNLPWTDAPGVLSDSTEPLVFYRVEFPDMLVHARKDLATDSVTLTF